MSIAGRKGKFSVSQLRSEASSDAGLGLADTIANAKEKDCNDKI